MRIFPARMAFIQLALAILLGGGIALVAVTMEIRWWWVLSVGVGGAVCYYLLAMSRYFRRRKLAAAPFPEAWREKLQHCVPFYRKLQGDGRKRFEKDIQIFLAEQQIYAVDGQDVTPEIKLLVAAGAAMLGHGLPDWEWPRMRDIVIYPMAFDESYQSGDKKHILGQVHAQGPILLSARDLIHGFCVGRDGLNVGLHELAHVMDMADGHADGIPVGLDWIAAAPWIKIVTDRLRKVRKSQCGNVLRQYAGVNEAEFFAVAVEAFFEKPKELKARDPELFSMLADYFNLDPESAIVRQGW